VQAERLNMEQKNYTDKDAVGYFYGVFYQIPDPKCPGEFLEWNFLAAFDTKEKAEEYESRLVWRHLDTFISRQPIF
jgi:hypothetical protein